MVGPVVLQAHVPRFQVENAGLNSGHIVNIDDLGRAIEIHSSSDTFMTSLYVES
jgi:hypothetical protein